MKCAIQYMRNKQHVHHASVGMSDGVVWVRVPVHADASLGAGLTELLSDLSDAEAATGSGTTTRDSEDDAGPSQRADHVLPKAHVSAAEARHLAPLLQAAHLLVDLVAAVVSFGQLTHSKTCSVWDQKTWRNRTASASSSTSNSNSMHSTLGSDK